MSAFDLEAPLSGSGAAAMTALAEEALAARWPEASLASLNLERLGEAKADVLVGVRLRVERETRTLVFATIDLFVAADGARLAAFGAVLRR